MAEAAPALSSNEREMRDQLLIAPRPEMVLYVDSDDQLKRACAAGDRAALAEVASILSADPEAAATADEAGFLPLHVAAVCCAHSGVVSVVAAAFSGAATAATVPDGFTPLHLAVIYGAPLPTVHAILAAGAAAAAVTTPVGEFLPLHAALVNRADEEVIEAVLDAYPQGAAATTSNGFLPLHLAVINGAAVDTVKAISMQYPSAMLQIAGDDWTPLHLAVSQAASFGVIEYIFSSYPGAAVLKDCAGCTPLHIAAVFGDSVELVQLLQSPLLYMERDKEGRTPLHLSLCSVASSFAVAFALLAAHPAAAAETDAAGRTPLHTATMRDAPLELIRSLLAAHPAAVSVQDRDGFSPLHWAVCNTVNISVVSALLAACPAVLSDVKGRTPLHWALCAKSRAPAAVITVLLGTAPQMATMKDEDGRCPLHWALYTEPLASREVFAALLAHPAAVAEADASGFLPLHQAVMNRAPVEVVADLLAAYPAAAEAVDGTVGLTPLHWSLFPVDLAIMPETVMLLLGARPGALSVKDSGGRLPMHLAARFGLNPGIIQLMLDAHPDAIAAVDGEGCTPLHLLLLTSDYAANATAFEATFMALFIAHPLALCFPSTPERSKLPAPEVLTGALGATAFARRMPAIRAWALARPY